LVSDSHKVAGEFDPLANVLDRLPTLDLIVFLNLIKLTIRKQNSNFCILTLPAVSLSGGLEIVNAPVLAVVAGAKLNTQRDAVLERHLKTLAVADMEHDGPFRLKVLGVWEVPTLP
jgi:hypothetical protein